MENKKEDYEIIEEDEFSSEGEQKFSHQQLVMKAMNKCLDAGSKEMKIGFWNNKLDKHGNVFRTYVEDTRKTFIESIETVEMFMICDFDKPAKDKIKKLKDDLDNTYKELCEKEAKEWISLSRLAIQQRRDNEILYSKGRLNIKLSYYQDYMEEEVRTAREIFKELTQLTKRIHFYEEEALIM